MDLKEMGYGEVNWIGLNILSLTFK